MAERSDFRVELSFPDAATFEAFYNRNIKQGGLFLEHAEGLRPFEMMDEVDLRVHMPGETQVQLSGQVVQVVSTEEALRDGGVPGYALQLAPLAPQEQERLDACLSLLMVGAVPLPAKKADPDDDPLLESTQLDDYLEPEAEPAPEPEPEPIPEPPAPQPAPEPVRPAPAAGGVPAAPERTEGGYRVDPSFLKRARVAASRIRDQDSSPSQAPASPAPAQQPVQMTQRMGTVPSDVVSASPLGGGRTMSASISPTTQASDKPGPDEILKEAIEFLERTSPADPFGVLGVGGGVSNSDLQAAYARLIKRYHPDGYLGDEYPQELGEKLRLITRRLTAARRTLLDPEERKAVETRLGMRSDSPSQRPHMRFKKTLRKQYNEQYRTRVHMAADLAKEGEELADAQDVEGAIAKFKLALSFDPLNDGYKARVKELEALRPPSED